MSIFGRASLDVIKVFISAFLVYVTYNFWVRRARADRATQQHGCKPAPRVQSTDRLFGFDLFVSLAKADNAGRRSEAFRQLHEKYGRTFEMKALSGLQLQTSEPENIQAICTSAFENFGVGPMRGRIGMPFLDRGIFTEDGAYWRHARAMIRPTFSRAEIADLDGFERHVKRLFPLIPSDGFLDTSTEFLFGQSLNSLLPEHGSAASEFTAAFDRSLLGLALLLIFGPLRWPLYLDPWWKAAYTKVHTFIDARVDRALARVRSPDKKAKEGNLNKYILLDEMAATTQDRYELRMQIINVFFPARDTAAIAFGDLIFELARHLREWHKLRAEVLAIDRQQPLTFELIKSLKRVKAIINESLRLHPAASRIGRAALKDTVLPRGGGSDGHSPVFVPKGRVIEMDLYTLQRDPSIWGEDADEFRPDRWAEGRPLWESRWQYQPFLGGIRMCPAQNQVLTQLAYLLVRFAEEFEGLENRDPVLEYVEKVRMTVESRNGVKIAVRRRRKGEGDEGEG
ncbi:MAG: hypothetical protein Q9227_007174 [Pyrenula ochraceoflavens]